MLFQCRTSVEDCGSTLKQHCVNATCLRKVYTRSSNGLLLGHSSVIELNQQWTATLAQHRTGIWWVGLHPLYEVHHRQVLNECWPAQAMVVEGIHNEDIFEIVSLVIFLIISWTFRILAHNEDQYTVMFIKH